jgi:hypothetical protein
MLATFPDFWDYSAHLRSDPESRDEKSVWLLFRARANHQASFYLSKVTLSIGQGGYRQRPRASGVQAI